MKERKLREQQKIDRIVTLEREKQRSLAQMMHNQKKAQIEMKLMTMEEKRKAFHQANHYSNKVVKDLLSEKAPKLEPYKFAKNIEDDLHMNEFLHKKRVGDQYLRDSYHDVRKSSAKPSASHNSSDLQRSLQEHL